MKASDVVLPEPKGQRLAYRCVAGDGEDEYEDFYSPEQVQALALEYYRRGVEDAVKVCEAKAEEYLARTARKQHSHGAAGLIRELLK